MSCTCCGVSQHIHDTETEVTQCRECGIGRCDGQRLGWQSCMSASPPVAELGPLVARLLPSSIQAAYRAGLFGYEDTGTIRLLAPLEVARRVYRRAGRPPVEAGDYVGIATVGAM